MLGLGVHHVPFLFTLSGVKCCKCDDVKSKVGDKNPLISMFSHGIPIAEDEDGNSKRGTQTTPKKKLPSQVHTGTRLYLFKDPARERADIPPGGARSRTFPETGRGRWIEQWQQLDPPFSISGAGKERWQTCHAGSEAKASTR